MSPLFVFAIKAAIATGAIAAAGHWIAAHLPPVNAHTPSAKLNAVIDVVGNACEGVVKTMLAGPLLVEVAQAAVNGAPIAGPLQVQLPAFKAAVLAQIGPAVQQALAEALGSSDAADKRLETEVLVAAREHALESVKILLQAPSGRNIVAPAPAS